MSVDEFGRKIPAPTGGRGEVGEFPDSFALATPRRSIHTSPAANTRRPEAPRRPSHPSFQYTDDPLLCEYVWKEKNPDATDDYDVYRRKYCLSYIRAFFNQHLDDSWFRIRYSPAARQKYTLTERNRAITEAKCLLKEASASDTAFVEHARLGVGQKKGAQTTTAPPSHLFSWQQQQHASTPTTSTALVVSEIPPSVTDEQLVLAFHNHTKPGVHWVVHASSTVSTGLLQRQAVVVGPSSAVNDLWKAFRAAASTSSSTNSAVPRKQYDDEHDDSNAAQPLQVDCTDPYGRLEIDADGRGGAPSDGLAVPAKKARVYVQKLLRTTSTAVLSAALSATARHESDAASAQQLAERLDAQRTIPEDCHWNTQASKLLAASASEEDVLDVCIAYLRRVHLVSFYNGCDQPAKSVADVLTGKHAASVVHLRLQNADELLLEAPSASTETTTADKPVVDTTKDMLVQRLETSIETALTQPPPASDTEDAQTIQDAEETVRARWLRDHSLLDDDNRARCAFHFCHKLFKDTNFLDKHLLKKHVEYLKGEQAKCHDDCMMLAWDAALVRPVPDVLVDAGARFGFVATAVVGQVPDVVDPEPALWARQEQEEDLRQTERREREVGMRARREDSRGHNNSTMNAPEQQQQQRGPFVDVDDMKEEKVELSFDNVQVVLPTKKKKKKRKLL
jgi:hypothetical protein